MSKTYGITPHQIQEVRDKIRKKVNYKCHFCGKDIRKISLKVSTHHIIPKCLLKKDYWNEDNLIVLCYICHNKLEVLNRRLLGYFLSKDECVKYGIGQEVKEITGEKK